MVAAVMVTGPNANADRVTFTDARGDTESRGLDIISGTVRNKDNAVVVLVQFARDRRATVAILTKTRDEPVIAIVSVHRRSGPDTTFVQSRHAKIPCPGVSSDWNRSAATLKLRMPATCLNQGNYGAIKSFVLIETISEGADIDYAPESRYGRLRYTDWISRG